MDTRRSWRKAFLNHLNCVVKVRNGEGQEDTREFKFRKLKAEELPAVKILQFKV